MRRKVEHLANNLKELILARIDTKAILICEASENDILDPYFTLEMDVYVNSPIPELDDRRKIYGKIEDFESSCDHDKDRFYINEIPVHIEYKAVENIEKTIEAAINSDETMIKHGTYTFHRLQKSKILFDNSNWTENIRIKLLSLPEKFWNLTRLFHQQHMEHCLSDLLTAAHSEDGFFYYFSLGHFLRHVAITLLIINQKFEPSMRCINEMVTKLKILPDGFSGRWDNLVRLGESTIAHQYEVAKLLAKSVMELTI